jgi:uncharacterized protein YuzE
LARHQRDREVLLIGDLEDAEVQFSYDPKLNIAYLRIREPMGAQVKTIPVSDEVNVDIAADGTVFGIELLNANDQLFQADGGRLVVEFAGERLEVPLPQPA